MECLRHGTELPPSSIGYVDTLDIAKAIERPCAKLQCQVTALKRDDLRAHRAVDDCFALGAVCKSIAESLGVPPVDLLSRFACGCDGEATAANLEVLKRLVLHVMLECPQHLARAFVGCFRVSRGGDEEVSSRPFGQCGFGFCSS